MNLQFKNTAVAGFMLIAVAIIFTSCTHDMNRREINNVDLVHCIGIDFENGEYTLSAVYDEDAGGEEMKLKSISASGETILEAKQELVRKNAKLITLSQTNYFLLGENATTHKLSECIDFIERDYEIKLDALVFVIKGETAKKLLEKPDELSVFAGNDLNNWRQKEQAEVKKIQNTVAQLVNSAVLIEAVEYIDGEVSSCGSAVIKNGELLGFVDNDIVFGISLLTDNVQTAHLYLADGVGVKITDFCSKLCVKNGIAEVKATFDTVIETAPNYRNANLSEKALAQIRAEQNYHVRTAMQTAIDLQREYGVDLIGINQLLEPSEISELADQLEFHFKISSRVILSQP